MVAKRRDKEGPVESPNEISAPAGTVAPEEPNGTAAVSVPPVADALPADAPAADAPAADGSKAPMAAAPEAAPRVSLLMPVMNVERYLPESLASARAQTLADIEIICIDDGSTDGSLAIMRAAAEEDGRIRVIEKANSGYGDSMNRALELARGTYIGILEPDDIMYPESLERLVAAAEAAQAEVAKGNFELYWTSPSERVEFFEVADNAHCAAPSRPLDDPFIFYQKPSIWSAVYRRDFLEHHGIRFLPTPGASFQDCSFSFKVFASAARVVYVHDSMLRYRQDNEGSSVNARNKVFCTCDEYAEIERWIAGEFTSEHGEAAARDLMRVEQVAKYDSYMWSYVRLAPEFRVMFLERMSGEFTAALDAGWFELDDLKPWKRANLAAIMRDPTGWVRDNASYAAAGPFGRMMHYLKLGGPGLLVSYALNRVRHE